MEKPKILIAEDESIVAENLQTHLEKLGYSVCGRADSAEEAIQFVRETKTDAILMDIMLKGNMTGIEAGREFCEKPRDTGNTHVRADFPGRSDVRDIFQESRRPDRLADGKDDDIGDKRTQMRPGYKDKSDKS